MPPKGKKGKKGKKSGKKASEAPGTATVEEEETDKEQLLENELKSLTIEHEDLKERLSELKKDNEWLNEEAYRIRLENHEYMNYIEKKTSKRQAAIVTLSDHNKAEVEKIREEKTKMLENYEKQKSELNTVRLEKENLLIKARKELDDLLEYKSLRDEQISRIRSLEKEVVQTRKEHNDKIRDIKTKFMEDRRKFENESEAKIQEVAREAVKEAEHVLNEHTSRTKSENRIIRQELLTLLHESRALQKHKKELVKQRQELLRERQFAEDLRQIRKAKLQPADGSNPTNNAV